MIDIRSELTPQLIDYDNIGLKWHPNIMFFQRENYRSKSVNTDKYGFRMTCYEQARFSPESYFESINKEEISLIVGGSTAFGVGATSDKYNLASLLSNNSGKMFLNFGGRAFNSDQELSLFKNFLEKLPKLKEVIIVSGVNELYLTSIKNKSFMPNFFYGNIYSNALDLYTLNYQRKILKIILGSFGIGEEIWKYKSLKQIFLHVIKNLYSFNKIKNSFEIKNTDLISFAKSLNRIKSSLTFWSCLSKILKFKVTFALQPIPSWSKKRLTIEEEKIFSFNDYKNPHLSNIFRLMDNQDKYLNYSKNLEDICNSLSVKYLDCNNFFRNSESRKDWLFVDRIHLNDKGYKELAKFLINE